MIKNCCCCDFFCCLVQFEIHQWASKQQCECVECIAYHRVRYRYVWIDCKTNPQIFEWVCDWSCVVIYTDTHTHFIRLAAAHVLIYVLYVYALSLFPCCVCGALFFSLYPLSSSSILLLRAPLSLSFCVSFRFIQCVIVYISPFSVCIHESVHTFHVLSFRWLCRWFRKQHQTKPKKKQQHTTQNTDLFYLE